MDKFELRIAGENNIWGDWQECNDHESVAKTVFGVRSRFIRSVRYEYGDGTMIEYRRMSK